MKTQAWGWLAAGVLAAGLNASYHDGGMQWAHELVDRVSDRSEVVLALATGRADRFVEAAQRVQDRDVTASCRLSTALAHAQTRLAHTQTRFARWEAFSSRAMSGRELAQLDRLEANRIRIEDRVNAQLVRIRVPEVPAVPAIPVVNVNLNEVKVHAACPRVQVHVPQVHVDVPAVHVEVPDVEVDDGDSGPI